MSDRTLRRKILVGVSNLQDPYGDYWYLRCRLSGTYEDGTAWACGWASTAITPGETRRRVSDHRDNHVFDAQVRNNGRLRPYPYRRPVVDTHPREDVL